MADFKVFLATEVRVYEVDGHYYADASFAKVLERYSKSFGKLSIVTIVINEKKMRNGYIQIDKFGCSFDNVGSLAKFVIKKTPQNISEHLRDADLVVMRLPSLISLRIYRLVRKHSKKYLTEVMGCAWDAYWNHGVVGKMLAPFMFIKMRRMVKKADYCVYVTQSFLQNRYPRDNKSVGISNVDITSVASPKTYAGFNKKNITLMTAAALDVKYKGQEYVIKAMRVLRDKYKIDTTYYLAGKGSSDRLKKIAEQNGVSQDVVFCGMLSRDELSKKMRETDIYIQPSLQEGLPRSLVEAMSRGCVCLGSKTAGIPELLKNRFVFKRRSVSAIVGTILKVIKTGELELISEENIEKSKEYLSSVLDKNRECYYDSILKDLLLDGGDDGAIKVAIINNHLVGGGAERVVCNLANYLCKKGYDVSLVATVGKKGSYALDERVTKEYLMSGFVSNNKIRCYREKSKRLKQYMKTHGDVSCYIAMMPWNAFMVAKMRRVTNAGVIISERNNPSSHSTKERLMMCYAAKRCDGLVVQTDAIGQWYKTVRRKEIIPNAINNDIVFPLRKHIEKRFVSVARLERQKNYPLLISAFNTFSKNYPDYTLEIYGQGSQEKTIRELIARYGLTKKVKLMGFVEDIPGHISNAECFVLSSDYEGMPNALIEAMCIGLPCISTDCDGGGARQLIKHEKNGLLVQKGDVDAMVSSMIEVVENKSLRDSISMEAKKLKDELNGEKIYSRWMFFINRVINDKKKNVVRSDFR